MRWNESHRASHLPPILHCCLLPSPSPPLRPLSSRSLIPPGSLRVSLSLRVPYSLLFHLRGFHLSPAFSPLTQPSTLFLVPFLPLSLSLPASSPPTRIRGDGKPWRAIHTRAHVHTAPKVFARGGQYSPTTRTTPSQGRMGTGASAERRAEEIRFYPAAVAETFFPYLGITSKLE